MVVLSFVDGGVRACLATVRTIGHPLLELADELRHTVASGAAKKVDSFDGRQALSESLEDSVHRWRTAAARRSFAADALQRSSDVLGQRLRRLLAAIA